MKFYAPDAVFLQPTGERISGTVALRNLFQTIMATFNSDITLYSQNLETSGDLAYDSGSFRENLVTIATGAKITSTGSYIIIFKHQSNGSWQIVQHVWTGIPLPAGVEARTPRYDVVSIKPNKSGSGRTSIGDNNDSFSATNISLKTLLVNAYDVRDYLISGLTGWANSDRFDVNAKIVDVDTDALKKLTDEQRNAMLQQMLADRFHMTVHLQTEVLPIYEMIVAKGGPKITAVEPIGPDPDADKNKTFKGMSRGNMRVSNTELTAHDVPLDSLAYALSGRLSRTVMDKTGLKGKFDLSLTWSPDDELRRRRTHPRLHYSLRCRSNWACGSSPLRGRWRRSWSITLKSLRRISYWLRPVSFLRLTAGFQAQCEIRLEVTLEGKSCSLGNPRPRYIFSVSTGANT